MGTDKDYKRVLGLDLGITSIGWALVDVALTDDLESKIVKLGVRVVPLSSDERTDFEKGRPMTTNAVRTAKRSARRNLQRYKLRRANLMEVLIQHGFIKKDTPLTEIGKGTTYQTLRLRAQAATEQVSLEVLARIFLAINKKRGYKSSRKAQGEEDGQAIDGMQVAKLLYDNNWTPGQYVLQLLQQDKKYIPDFYRSDLKAEFDQVWSCQRQFYPAILTDDLYTVMQGKNKKQSWTICKEPFQLEGIKLTEKNKTLKGAALKKKIYALRALGIEKQLEPEHLAIVLSEINNNLDQSSGYLGELSDRSKALYFNQQTVGQYIWKQIQENRNVSLKNQVFYRQDYLDEFEQIWETQSKYYKQLTPALKTEIRDIIIFYQRPLKSQKGLLSFCPFESQQQKYLDSVTKKEKTRTIGRRVIAKSSPLFQEFKIWQNLNFVVYENKVTKEQIELKSLDQEIRQDIFDTLNIRGNMKSKVLLKVLSKYFKLGKISDWTCNYEEIEGNRTNQALYNVYQEIARREGHGVDWVKKSASEIKEELKATFPLYGLDPELLEFDANMEGETFDRQPAYQLWHLLYSTGEDSIVKWSQAEIETYGSSSVQLKKKLEEKFGFKPEYTKLLVNIALQQDYGSLSSKAIRKIIPYLQQGHLYSRKIDGAGVGAIQLAYPETKSVENRERLELLPKNSLRNPVVEKILNQMINAVNQLIDTYGKIDEISIELTRELKKNAKERADMTKNIAQATKHNEDIKKKIMKDFQIPNPTKSDVIRYRLWEELRENGYKDIFRNKKIPKEQLFSKNIEIEHIIPRALLFDDSYSNKTLAYSADNTKKGKRTALDYISKEYEADLEDYKARVEALYKDGKGSMSKAKRNKLLMTQQDLPDGFIERDLRNTQYIARKAKEILQQIVEKKIVSTSGKITNRLREDWGLVNVMKALNMPKYRALGLTEVEQRWDKGAEKWKSVEVITDWTKRNDHRHHAMDALVVAFTTHNHIQYLNHLNARGNRAHDKYHIISNIEEQITENETRKNGTKKRKFIVPMKNFRSEAEAHIQSILVSVKNKNKVVTQNVNVNKTSEGVHRKLQLTPRGQLHKETVYGQSKRLMDKSTRLNKRFSVEQAHLIAHSEQRKLVLDHLSKFEHTPSLAFDTKTLKKHPILYRDAPLKEVRCYEKIFTIRKDVSPDLKIDKVVDPAIRKILQQRLDEHGGNAKTAFSNLDKAPIWFNKRQGKSIKRVTITGMSNAQALHYKKNHLGQEIVDDSGQKHPVDFVSTGNNHHVAVYRDEAGKLQEKVCSFYEAVVRVNEGLPIVDKEYNADLGWSFLFTMKQNEMFVFPNEDFDIDSIDLMDVRQANKISKHLYRVQKIATKNYMFRHHLDTTVQTENSLKEITYKNVRSTVHLLNLVKVRINHIGHIVQVGEY